MSNMREEIKALVVDILEVDSEQLEMETNFVKDLGIDSLLSLEIMAVLEKKYKIKIPEESMKRMVDLKQVIEVVEEAMAEKTTIKDGIE